MRLSWWGALLISAALGCGDDGGDGSVDGATMCATASDCDDGAFCNGAEVCDPTAASADGRGCVGGSSPCMAGQTCDEVGDGCDTMCGEVTDADGDGVDAVECGGDDCDDADAERYPGNEEVCDAEDHDEDCDPTTYGAQDADGDGYDDAACCNVDEGTPVCGDDCDDGDPTTHPDEAESCDEIDNDCDGSVDERVQRTFYFDFDRDGYGEEGGAPVLACVPPDMHVENDDDCDDTESTIRPGATEVCDGVDEDCNDIIDDNPASDDSCRAAHGTAVCRSGACVLEDCDADYDDCDSNATNGCETDLRTLTDCGACDSICDISGASETCVTGTCEADSCAAGLADCDTNGSCETNLYTTTDCGACSRGCAFDNAVASCPLGMCTFDGCDDDWADCNDDIDDVPTDGCETSLITTTDCGGCGIACDPANGVGDCSSGTCAIDSCSGTYRNCTGGVGDGCESDIDTDEAHCGGCGNMCVGVCFGGTCQDVAGVVGGGNHTCAWLTNGTAWCWGDNRDGQLGDGTKTSRDRPVRVTGMPNNVVGMTAGAGHTCAWMSGGRLYCWGDNGTGQIGDGSMTDRTSPVWISGMNVAQAAAGASHTCALRTDERVLCWGQNLDGQIGDGTNTRRLTPALVFGDGGAGGVIDLGAGGNQSCAVQIWEGEHRAFCWGDNADGQLGDGTTMDRDLPVLVMGLPAGSTEVGVGNDHVCAAHGSGVSCWGANDSGQLGDGTTTERHTPVPVNNLTGTNYVTLSVGGAHGCVSKEFNRVNCWGSNLFTEIGDGTMMNRTSPVQVSNITTAVSVGLGSSHSCALLSNGTLRCWGDNSLGKLGDGTETSRSTPVVVGFVD